MSSRVVRSLVLACSLLCALPQGWCCIVACHLPIMQTTPPEEANGCCACAKHGAQPQQTPAKKPAVPPVQHCPCNDYLTILASPPLAEQNAIGFTVIALVSFVHFTPLSTGFVEMAGWTLTPPSPTLQLVHCVWLC